MKITLKPEREAPSTQHFTLPTISSYGYAMPKNDLSDEERWRRKDIEKRKESNHFKFGFQPKKDSK